MSLGRFFATFFCAILAIAFDSCNRVKESAKEAINKTGETVGRASGEFFEGVAEGIDRSLDCNIILSPALTHAGVETGKFSITDTLNGSNNLLSVYLIFNQAFEGSLMAKAKDKKGLELGRSKVSIDAAKGDAGYIDFVFPTRTRIEVKSNILVE